jgi:hypothetical protein
MIIAGIIVILSSLCLIKSGYVYDSVNDPDNNLESVYILKANQVNYVDYFN